MDGLDTLSQVALADSALADQLNLSFDTYHPTLTASGGPRVSVSDIGDDNLNTPVTCSSDVNFNFNPDMEFSQEPLPITGKSHPAFLSSLPYAVPPAPKPRLVLTVVNVDPLTQ